MDDLMEGPGGGNARAATGQADSGDGWSDSAADQTPGGYQPPGYAAETSRTGWPADTDDDAAASWTDDDQGDSGGAWPGGSLTSWNQPPPPAASNAVRGFPPAPGEPLPVYPPGPFAAWNRSSQDRTGTERGLQDRYGRGRVHEDTSPRIPATITPDEFDTNHSIPAIKDPVLSKSGRSGPVSGSRPGSAAGIGSGTSGTGSRSGSRSGSGSGARSEPGRDRRPPAAAGAGRTATAPGSGRSAGRPGSARARSGRKHQSAWLAIGAAVAIIAVGTVVLVLTSAGSSPAKTPKAGKTPQPVHSTAAAPAGRWEYIGSRTTDAVPLNMAELYPATFTSAKTVYTKVTQTMKGSCRSAVIGSTLQGAVRKAGCSQALRATYVARAPGVMATIGVFNLRTSGLARHTATKAGHFNFVAQLQSKAGPARHIGQGTGIEEASFKGHYLILVWAEATNLRTPSGKADRARLEAFMNLLIRKTANVGLSYRMVDGKPSVTPGG